MKVIVCNTPNGQYYIPLKNIAEDRANYYADEGAGHEKNSPEWQEEVDWVMEDSFEAIDWLLNNYEWEDWSDCAVKINDGVFVTEDDFWTSSDDFEIEDI